MSFKTIATAGNKGKRVRSDCHASVELTDSGGLQIDLQSKVKFMFGNDITELIKKVCSFFEIGNAKIIMQDSGALPFVMAARLEAAIKKVMKTEKEFLFDIIEENKFETGRDQNRFSRLYLPGNTPSLMLNAGLHKPNGLILDLEDAVAHDKKHEARFIVRNALRNLNFYSAEKMVRINQIPVGLEDLDYIIQHGVNLILVPKCESADQIKEVNDRIDQIQSKLKEPRNVWLMPIIESALGVIKAFEIASAAQNIVALAVGLEDYTADLGVRRTAEGSESFFARSMVVNACKATGIQAIDSVYSDVGNMEGLKQNVIASKSLGFDGMGCIHPRQIKVIHENFAPDSFEIEKSKKIVNAFIVATENGLGVVSLGTKMIDAPIVKRAQKVIDMAINLELLDINWREEFLAEKK